MPAEINGLLIAGDLLLLAALVLSRVAPREQRLARWSVILAGLVLVAALAISGWQRGAAPPVTPYEFGLAVIGGLLVVHLTLSPGAAAEHAIPLLLSAAWLALTLLLLFAPRSWQMAEPQPLLRGAWFLLHRWSAALGYATLAAALLWSLAAWLPARLPTLSRWLPEREALASSSTAAARWSVSLLTLSVVAGSLWTLSAWATIWIWDRGESWVLVVWLLSLLWLHAHALPRQTV